jgi:AraC-like DNA-binding protein
MSEGPVGHSKRKDAVALPTASGVLSRLAAQRATQAGIDVAPLLKKFSLPADLLTNLDARVSVRSQIAFVGLVAEVLEDDLLGFHLARDADLREAGPIYHLMSSSETLGDAFEHASRYSSVFNEGIELHRGTSAFTIEFRYIGIKRHLDRHQIEFWITCALRLSRLFTGRELIPLYVSFLHHREGDTSEMGRYFGCRTEFGGANDQISFDIQEAKLSLVFADPFLNRFLVNYYEEVIAGRYPKQQSVRTRVENAIVPRLPHGTMSIGNIADDLIMSARTLSRRLAQEGVTFSTILEELRSDLASRYLQNNNLSISQIAWLLGYSEVSSFVHAFQRWTGSSPTHARRQISDALSPEEF